MLLLLLPLLVAGRWCWCSDDRAPRLPDTGRRRGEGTATGTTSTSAPPPPLLSLMTRLGVGGWLPVVPASTGGWNAEYTDNERGAVKAAAVAWSGDTATPEKAAPPIGEGPAGEEGDDSVTGEEKAEEDDEFSVVATHRDSRSCRCSSASHWASTARNCLMANVAPESGKCRGQGGSQ